MPAPANSAHDHPVEPLPPQLGRSPRVRILAATGEQIKASEQGHLDLDEVARRARVSVETIREEFATDLALIGAMVVYMDAKGASDLFLGDALRGWRGVENAKIFLRESTERPGMTNFNLRLRTDASDPQHPLNEWTLENRRNTLEMIEFALRAGVEDGEMVPDLNVELVAIEIHAVIDGLKLHWMSTGDTDAMCAAMADYVDGLRLRIGVGDARRGTAGR